MRGFAILAWAAAVLVGAVLRIDGAQATDFRVEGNIGWSAVLGSLGTDIDLSNKFDSRLSLNTSQSADGPTGGLGFWVDDWITDNLSLGLQRIYSNPDDDSRAKVTLLGGRIARTETKLDLRSIVSF